MFSQVASIHVQVKPRARPKVGLSGLVCAGVHDAGFHVQAPSQFFWPTLSIYIYKAYEG